MAKVISGTLEGSDGIAPPYTKEYTTGYNDTGSAIAQGTVLMLDTTATGDDLGFHVAPSTVTNENLVVGVAEEAIAAGAWSDKIVVRGVVDALVSGGTTDVAAGDDLTLHGSNAGTIDNDGDGTFTACPETATVKFVALEASTGTSAVLTKVKVSV